jgi:AAHS family 4-hydroxybenzoate transporter-like MFS transporter
MLGIGRLGGILGSLVGGALLSLGFSFSTVFSVLAIPAIVAAVAIVMNRLALRFITNPVVEA